MVRAVQTDKLQEINMSDVINFNAQRGEPWFRDDGDHPAVMGSEKLVLIQSWNVTYNQQVTPLYECGTSKVYFSAKHQAGNLTVDRVWAEAIGDMKNELGEICVPKDVYVYAQFCNSERSAKLVQNFITGVTLSGNSQQGHVGENLTCQFVSLED